MAEVVLVHGAATTSGVWEPVMSRLVGLDVIAPTRPSSGDLEEETDWLESLVDGAVVFGMSGGATLVLELAARGCGARALIAHEPAAGSSAPGFFAPLRSALERGGVAAFGAELYGPAWSAATGLDEEAVRRDVAMFASFEPRRPGERESAITLVTTGARSPATRHDIAALLSRECGYRTRIVEDASHFVAKENPDWVADLVRSTLAGLPEATGSG